MKWKSFALSLCIRGAVDVQGNHLERRTPLSHHMLAIRSCFVSPSSAASSRRRMSSACRWVPVFSKMLERWVLAVASEMPRRVAAAMRPSPFKISVASPASAAVRPKRRRRLISRRRRSTSGSCTVTIATGSRRRSRESPRAGSWSEAESPSHGGANGDARAGF